MSKGIKITRPATVKLTFEIPVSQLSASKDGHWLNLPYRVEGTTEGLKGRKALIIKGRVMVPLKEQAPQDVEDGIRLPDGILG